jgi:dynactin complex subunit
VTYGDEEYQRILLRDRRNEVERLTTENTSLREQLEATTQGREDFRKHVVSIREAVGIALPDEDTIDAVRRLREQLRLAQEQLKEANIKIESILDNRDDRE